MSQYCGCQAYETKMRSIEYLWVREHGAQGHGGKGHGGKGHGVIVVSFLYIDNMMDFTIIGRLFYNLKNVAHQPAIKKYKTVLHDVVLLYVVLSDVLYV